MAEALIAKHRSNGVVVDTNILLLSFIGNFDRTLIPRFKRTEQFTGRDYEILEAVLAKFRRLLTTTGILTEIRNLSGQLGEPVRTRFFEAFAQGIAVLDERHTPGADLARIEQEVFVRFGITDSGIAAVARQGFLVLTDDFRLSQFLSKAGLDVINFNHLRST